MELFRTAVEEYIVNRNRSAQRGGKAFAPKPYAPAEVDEGKLESKFPTLEQ